MKKVIALKITQKQGLDMKAQLLNSMRTLFFCKYLSERKRKTGGKNMQPKS